MYTLHDIAKMTGQHNETIRRAVRAGKLKASKKGKGYTVSPSDLQSYLVSIGQSQNIEIAGTRFINARTASGMLGISSDQLKEYIRSGDLKARVLNTETWIAETELKRFLLNE